MSEGKKKEGAAGVVWSSEIYPLGVVYCALSARGLVALWISPVEDDATFLARLAKDGLSPVKDAVAVKKVFHWLDRYFAGKHAAFPYPLDPRGTDFEKSVWKAIAAIPRGEVRTYGAIAAAVGRPGAARAVGGACGRNPIPVIVPCHRVRAAGGEGGYTGGLHIKRALLRLEGVKP